MFRRIPLKRSQKGKDNVLHDDPCHWQSINEAFSKERTQVTYPRTTIARQETATRRKRSSRDAKTSINQLPATNRVLLKGLLPNDIWNELVTFDHNEWKFDQNENEERKHKVPRSDFKLSLSKNGEVPLLSGERNTGERVELCTTRADSLNSQERALSRVITLRTGANSRATDY